tara:strand:+ start:14321 stop:14635 length:315 start_codon:yes stop_codon:yes gene_type:complete
MGQSAKCNMRVSFNTEFIPIELTSSTSVHQSLLQFYKDTRSDDTSTPTITVTEHEQFDTEIQLEFYSTKVANLDFQVDLFKEYLEARHNDEVEDIDEDVWIQRQ